MTITLRIPAELNDRAMERFEPARELCRRIDVNHSEAASSLKEGDLYGYFAAAVMATKLTEALIAETAEARREISRAAADADETDLIDITMFL